MALKKKFDKTEEQNAYKYSFNDSYLKIDSIEISVLREEARVGVRWYANEEARRAGEAHGIYKKNFTINLNNLEIVPFSKEAMTGACYNYLKTLDEFKNAQDC